MLDEAPELIADSDSDSEDDTEATEKQSGSKSVVGKVHVQLTEEIQEEVKPRRIKEEDELSIAKEEFDQEDFPPVSTTVVDGKKFKGIETPQETEPKDVIRPEVPEVIDKGPEVMYTACC